MTLTELRQLAAAASVLCQTHVYKVFQGCQVRADVYRAPAGERPSPAIMFIHGGALIMGSRRWLNPTQVDAFCRAGYIVVAVDYRLAPETKLPAIIEDVQDAYRWLRESGPSLFGIDAQRIAVMGASAGGYLTLMSGAGVGPRWHPQ
ncbi:MAG: alpha/beta hydrolase [Anaerolineae bacterium]